MGHRSSLAGKRAVKANRLAAVRRRTAWRRFVGETCAFPDRVSKLRCDKRKAILVVATENQSMPTFHLVRHGRAAAGFGAHADPGLDDVGRRQAKHTAAMLAAQIAGPIPIYSSPLARARETAAPLAERWGVDVLIETRVAEIPSPTDDLRERARWLAGIMTGRWTDLPEELKRWRRDMVNCVLGFETDAVVFCHFIAINVLVGAATGAEDLITFRPDNGSVTRLRADGTGLGVLELGAEASTRVN